MMKQRRPISRNDRCSDRGLNVAGGEDPQPAIAR
jgi:hypothetical protein